MGETFAEAIKYANEEVNTRFKNLVIKYKEKVDQTRKEKHFKVDDLVLAYLRKERLPKGQYHKLMKKIGPCKIIYKNGDNAYEIELLPDIWDITYFQHSRYDFVQRG